MIKEDFIDISIPDIENTIDNWIKSQRDREMLKRKLIDGITFEQLAEEFDMSVRGVKYVVYRNKEILLRHIKREH
jgi:hypothetical protein